MDTVARTREKRLRLEVTSSLVSSRPSPIVLIGEER
jgi:hypothetical protein